MKSNRQSHKSNYKVDMQLILLILMIGLCLIIWTVSVIKVIILDKSQNLLAFQNNHWNRILFPRPPLDIHPEETIDIKGLNIPPGLDWDYNVFSKSLARSEDNVGKDLKHNSLIDVAKIKLDSGSTVVVGDGAASKSKELMWPPVLEDGTLPESDGFDIMMLTELKVPKFWVPPSGLELETVGTKVGGHETIFLMIASYRDFQCHETITSAFSLADHPERLFVGAVDQIVPGDMTCTYTEQTCEENPSQPICKYRSQISVYTMNAEMATGPVTARHIGDRLYRGQYFVMQMDAHCKFVRHWDTDIIGQFRMTGNEMAVLSSYLSDVQGSIDRDFKSTRNTRPIMCNSDFEGIMPARYLRHGAQPEDRAVVRDMPQLQPFWAAGFSFSRGHFKVRVPYDGLQPMVFQVSL